MQVKEDIITGAAISTHIYVNPGFNGRHVHHDVCGRQ